MSTRDDMNEHTSDLPVDGMELLESPGLEDLGSLTAAVERAYPAEPLGDFEAAHLAAMFAAAAEMGGVAEPATDPEPATWRSGLRARWSHLSLAAKALIGAVALTFAFTGAAVAGDLPPQIQHAVHAAAATVGVEIPDPAPEAVETEQDEKAETTDDEAVKSGPHGADEPSSHSSGDSNATAPDSGSSGEGSSDAGSSDHSTGSKGESSKDSDKAGSSGSHGSDEASDSNHGSDSQGESSQSDRGSSQDDDTKDSDEERGDD